MAQKLKYSTATNEIQGVVTATPPPEGPGYADIPNGFKPHKASLWKYDPGTETVVRKTGQELQDAKDLLKPTLRADLITKYLSGMVGPVTQGSFEAVIDCLLHVVNLLTQASSLDAGVKAKVLALKTTAAPHVLLDFDSATQADWDDMAAKKKAARDLAAAMFGDKDWNADFDD